MAVAAAERAQERMTAEQYSELPETNKIQELLGGELIMSPAPAPEHQDAALAVAIYLKQLIPSGRVQIVPSDVYLDKRNVVQPDVFWAGSEGSNCQIGSNRRWRGAPDLVVEILSPGTARHDRGVKSTLYEKHGVREYWLVEPAPEAQFVEVYVLSEGRFVRQGLYEPKDTFTSPVLGGQAVETGKLFG